MMQENIQCIRYLIFNTSNAILMKLIYYKLDLNDESVQFTLKSYLVKAWRSKNLYNFNTNWWVIRRTSKPFTLGTLYFSKSVDILWACNKWDVIILWFNLQWALLFLKHVLFNKSYAFRSVWRLALHYMYW